MKYCCENEKIAIESSYEKNESFKKEGHDLHLIRIVIHKLSVEAVEESGEKWNKFNHKCPVKMFSEKLEKLIDNAVDLGNWATIENYDPTGGFDY